MNETASIRRAKHPVIAGVCMAAVFAVSLVVCLWALELTSIPFLKQLDDTGRNIASVVLVIASFALIYVVSWLCLSGRVGRMLRAIPDNPPRFLGLFCCCNMRSVVMTSAVILVFWVPILILFYPGVTTFDGVNQLYQYSNPAPTWYSTMLEWVDAEFIDHHPVFDTLVYGAFVYGAGGLFGSQNAGMFCLTLFQALLGACALGGSICYLERLGVPAPVRLVSVLFAALFPLFPINAATMLKDTLHAPFFLLFAVLFVELCRTKGRSLQSPRVLVGLCVVAILCALTKKTGLYVAVPSLLIAGIVYRKARIWIAAAVPALVAVVLVPCLVYPLLGGVASGGRQEMLALPFQQTTTVALEAADDVTADEVATIDRVLDLEKAKTKYSNDLADGAKNSFRRSATASDMLAYLGVWAAQGVRHPDLYLKSMLLCSGSMLVPSEQLTIYTGMGNKANKYFTEKSASIGQSFVCSLERPAELADAVESYNSGFTTVATGNPITAFFFSKGLWGGWLPIFCILVALILDRKRAFWLFPIVLAVLMLVLCPVDDARYVFPMLYCAPLLVGVAASAMMQPAQLHDGRLRHAKN